MMTRRVLALLVLAFASRGAAQEPLPDLVPSIDESIRQFPVRVLRDQSVPASDVGEGCAGGTTGRTLVRFTLTTVNQGTADLVLGDPGCPTCNVDPPPMCTNPYFECSLAEGHHHPHFEKYALYEVLPRADAAAAAVGHKQGFCLEDTICDVQKYHCSFQGLSLGCMDAYFSFLGCQYVDVTDLPNGRYLLRVTVNYARIIKELDYDNNVDQKPIEFCDGVHRPTVRLQRAGRWAATGRVAFAKAPLLEADPARDGALVRLTVGTDAPLEVAIPGGARGTGCKRADGWKTIRHGKTWLYKNTSGFLDQACSDTAGGIERLHVVATKQGFTYAVRGRFGSPPATVPQAVDTTLVLGAVTGPCGAGHAGTCRARGQRVTCIGSPSGAQLDGDAFVAP